MTWGEFKEWAAARGVKDTDEIGFIDFATGPWDDEPMFKQVSPERRIVDIS